MKKRFKYIIFYVFFSERRAGNGHIQMWIDKMIKSNTTLKFIREDLGKTTVDAYGGKCDCVITNFQRV